MMTITITGTAGCGKTWAADKIAEMLEASGETVRLIDEYSPNRKWKEREKQEAVASKPNVLILVTETRE